MKRIILLILLSFYLIACEIPEQASEQVEFGFVTRLGSDTLAMESIRLDDASLTADVVFRSPRVQTAHYSIDLTGDRFGGMETTWTREGDTLMVEMYVLNGDSVRYERDSDGEIREFVLPYDPSVLPFIDMVHWPFEIMSTRLGNDTTEFPVLAVRRGFSFRLWKYGEGNMIIRHPTRGEMDVKIDQEGHITSLNASRTTRALTVNRTGSIDIADWEAKFLERENSEGRFGGLSGRGSGEYDIDGAHITLDFGQPMKRGRDIWGGLVKYDRLWRTGANRATHLSSDKDLAVGDLRVPAGEYTLFSIPGESQLTLIINKQTGQNGQQYDESQDLGRVQMDYRSMEEVVEPFTIIVSQDESGTYLRLQWDDGEYVVPVKVL